MIGGCWAAKRQSIRKNARQHRAFNSTRHFCSIGAHQIMHNRSCAGQGANGNIDRRFGFKATHQFMMVNHSANIGLIDYIGQFCRVIGINDHHRRPGCNL